MAPDTESGYKGVSKNGWQARTGPKSARRYLGTFESKLEAAVAIALDAPIGGGCKEDGISNPQSTEQAVTVVKAKGEVLPLAHACFFPTPSF